MSSFLYRLGRTCYQHRGRVLAGWLAVLALLGLLTITVGGKFDDSFNIPGAESTVALNQLKVTFPDAADATATVLVTAPPGQTMNDPAVKQAIKTWSDELNALPFVNGLIGPYNDHIDGLISDDHTSGRITVRVQGQLSTFGEEHRTELTDTAKTLETRLPGSQVLVGGDVFSTTLPELSVVEALGLVVALIVLIATLGSLIGAIMPIGTAVTGVGMAVMLVMIGAGVITISSTTLILAIMLGLAVGIDYALFILSRHRDQLATGMEAEESAARAIGTAGSAVVFAGLTVIIALVGLSIANIPFLSVMGIFGAVGVAVEVALALTLLPAFIGFAGERLRPKAVRKRMADATQPATPPPAKRRGVFASAWVKAATRWPIVTIVVILAALGALSYPAKDLYLALPTSGYSHPGAQDRVTFDEVSRVFGIGFNGPLVITGSVVESDDPMGILDCLRTDIEQVPGVKMVAAAVPNANADTAMVQVIPTTGPADPATADLVHELRSRHQSWKTECGIDTAITGFTAVQIDVTERLWDALLPFGIFVVGLSLVLLAMVFRSIWVPVKAALGYLLSVGAAFGATTLVFNQGWAAQVVNLVETGPVISFLPIILMGLLFGLAMDYEVFLVSRMREEFVHGNDDNWVVDGFVHSAKVVTAAALIMFAVFAFFVPNGDSNIKPIAFGLAVGVAVDAFVVRMTLVPAVLKLLGRHAWWLPTWLDHAMPVLDIEGEALTRQVELATWPKPGDTARIIGEGLRAEVAGKVLFTDLDLRAEPGEVLVVEGTPAERQALLYGLAGRLRLSGGKLKVLSRVLPEEAPLLRRDAKLLSPSSTGFRQALAGELPPLVLVDRADELSPGRESALIAAMNKAVDDPPTWVLAMAPGSEFAEGLPLPTTVVRLGSSMVGGMK